MKKRDSNRCASGCGVGKKIECHIPYESYSYMIFGIKIHPKLKPKAQLSLKALDSIGINQSDAAVVANMVRGRNNIKHWFMGHYHRPMSGQWLGIPFSCLRSLMLQASLDFTTTDKMLGKHEQPQYCVVLLEDDKTVVHYHDFADTSEVHDTGYITE